eukprot:09854.XXX_253527_253706_1 [CDS] Oithona nana genome sequencing.
MLLFYHSSQLPSDVSLVGVSQTKIRRDSIIWKMDGSCSTVVVSSSLQATWQRKIMHFSG